MLQENRARQIFRKTNISFLTPWYALRFSGNMACFIFIYLFIYFCSFTLLPTILSLFLGSNIYIVWKISKYSKNFSGPYFPIFGLNIETYIVNFCSQSEYKKINTRKISVFRYFSHSVVVCYHFDPKEFWGQKFQNFSVISLCKITVLAF